MATVFVGYGPSECNAAAVWYRVPAVDAPSPLPIGKGTGVSTWVLDPASSERLMPVGAVGELYLQGPLVGRGYLGDDETTAAAFIDSPGWLVRGSPDGSVPGRSGARLYKTGDLVRYNADDGSLVFLGRKDAQVKLRGQRIELGEVEHHLRQCLAAEFAEPSVAAEVVVPAATGSATLAAFVQIPAGERPRFQEAIRGLEDALKKRLPAYMVPSAYIPLEAIPLAPSGKTDRKALRGLGVGLTLEQLDGGDDAGEDAEVTGLAIRLREMWAALLPVPIDKIRATSSFLRVGGDSISAMRLAALARTGGFSLSVANILRNPVLSKMAETMADLRQQDGDLGNMAIPAFSLLKTTKDAALAVLTSQCRVEASQIQDAFPCTGVQKSLLSMTAKSEGSSYIARFLLRLRPGTDARRLRQAWEDVSRTAAPILRYRIVDLPREGLVQAQIDEALEWDAYESVEACLGRDGQRGMGLGDRLTRLALVQDEEGPCCVLTQHHAIYDGYSMDLLLNQVARAYAGTDDESPLAPFQAFVKEYVVDANQQEARDFWRGQFAESEAVPFPALPSADYRPRADSTVKRHIGGLAWPKRNATASTVIRAAWSVLTSRYTDSHDVVFGAMVTGRQGSLPGIGRARIPLQPRRARRLQPKRRHGHVPARWRRRGRRRAQLRLGRHRPRADGPPRRPVRARPAPVLQRRRRKRPGRRPRQPAGPRRGLEVERPGPGRRAEVRARAGRGHGASPAGGLRRLRVGRQSFVLGARGALAQARPPLGGAGGGQGCDGPAVFCKVRVVPRGGPGGDASGRGVPCHGLDPARSTAEIYCPAGRPKVNLVFRQH